MNAKMNNSSNIPIHNLLNEVLIIRPLSILIIVVYHSFAIYDGTWRSIPGIDMVTPYYWIAKFATGFHLEVFVFVSGYIFSYQTRALGRKFQLFSFAQKKFKRLILPTLFFGFIYFLVFRSFSEYGLSGMILEICSGVGHLWFLPMLFWCFLFIWLVDKYNINKLKYFIFLVFVSIVPIPFALPFGLSRVPHFLLYIYCGYEFYIHREEILQHMMNARNIAFFTLVYMVLVIVQYTFIVIYDTEYMTGNIDKLVYHTLINVNRLFFSASGIMALYLVVCKYTTRSGFQIKQWVIGAGSFCYGVYIYHQFILHLLYDNTSLPLIFGSYFLPFVACTITLVSSLILTFFTLKTAFGKSLIG